MSYTQSQSRAIAHPGGPALVLAGPGCGKTLVITNRIRYLTENGMADPARILVITFSKAAALEMKQRYFACLPPDAPHNRTLVTFGTFHAVFFQILRAS
ncbi:MAG: UvrD-helicase domain-containing protein, partial [Lachnospiraceae bacterium]|nr:UvrD-helicase domain-containing protein [Lachnospiraceae bacterium]